MTGLRYSPLHVTEFCGEMQGKFKVGSARLTRGIFLKTSFSNYGAQLTGGTTIFQTRETMFHRDIQTPRRELKIRHAEEYF